MAALLGLSAGANAADLPQRAAAPSLFAPAPAFTWTGFYAGANAGYGFGSEVAGGRLAAPGFAFTPQGVRQIAVPVTPAAGGAFLRRSEADGVLAGGQAGYNMQFGMFVVGFEADIQRIDLGNGEDFSGRTGRAVPIVLPGQNPFSIYPTVPGASGNVAFFDRGQLDFFGTARGRVGAALDRVLIYATGGLAWGSWNDRRELPDRSFFVNNIFTPSGFARAQAVAAAAREKHDTIGWTVGAGVEYAFTDAITARIEGLYVDLGGDDRGSRIVGVTNTGLRIRQFGGRDGAAEFGLVRAAVNVRLGGL